MPRTQDAPAAAVRRPVLPAAATGRLLAGLAALLVVLTVLVALRWQPLMHLDHAVARWAFDRTHGHRLLTSWWSGLAAVSEPINLRVLMAVAGLVLIWRGRRALGGWLVGVAVLEQLVGPYAKYLLNRPRPHWTHPIETLSTSSYPAGHATGIACFASAVVLLALSLLASDRARRAVVALAVVLVVLVAADRLLLGMHYLSDVAGGLVLGVMTTLVCWLVMLRVTSQSSSSVRE
jgi:undecaprenyl-diphosphatase